MLLPLVQHGTAPLLQALRPVSHEYFGTRPQAMSEAATTPRGWKTESQARRKRRLLGRNSSVMVASMGMLPGRGGRDESSERSAKSPIASGRTQSHLRLRSRSSLSARESGIVSLQSDLTDARSDLPGSRARCSLKAQRTEGQRWTRSGR